MEPEHDLIEENIRAVLEFYSNESQKISSSQRILERISDQIGQPLFLALILMFVALWILANSLLHAFGRMQFVPAATRKSAAQAGTQPAATGGKA